MDQTARRYSQPPSRQLSLSDPYLAYCLDAAAALAGLWRDAEQNKELRRQLGKEAPGEQLIPLGINPSNGRQRFAQHTTLPVLSQGQLRKLLGEVERTRGKESEVAQRIRKRIKQIQSRPNRAINR